MENLSELKKRALASLKSVYFAVLATADEGGRPHASAVLIDSDEDFTVYFMTREKTDKHHDLTVRPEISLTVGMTSPIYLQITGRAERITEPKQFSAIAERLARVGASVENFWPPLARMGPSPLVAYRVRPTAIKAIDMTADSISQGGSPIVTIL